MNEEPLTNMTRPIDFNEHTSYPPTPGATYYYVCKGVDSRQTCCPVERPCVHHDPDPAVRQRRHVAYMKWKHDKAKATFDQAEKVRDAALMEWCKAEKEYYDVLKEYGMDTSEFYAQHRNS